MSISRETFDPTKNYKRIRYHQDRDLLDSELNEQQDIINLERRKIADMIESGHPPAPPDETKRKLVEALRDYKEDHDEQLGDVPMSISDRRCSCSMCQAANAALAAAEKEMGND